LLPILKPDKSHHNISHHIVGPKERRTSLIILPTYLSIGDPKHMTAQSIEFSPTTYKNSSLITNLFTLEPIAHTIGHTIYEDFKN
jgi:hypothetical protein